MLISSEGNKVLARRVLDLDFDEIGKWMELRGQKMPHRDLFPKIGFIVCNVATGFIYFTDSKIAIIDCYYSNPNSDALERNEALDKITDELIKSAIFHNIRMIKCDSTHEAIKRRALKFGFKNIGMTESFILEL